MRRKGVRAAAVGLSLATLVATGCSATHDRPAARTAPTAGAPTTTAPNDRGKSKAGGVAVRPHRCRATIRSNNLTAPFWLGNEHFDPARRPPIHTARQALAAYRADAATRGFPRRDLQVAYGDYSVTWRKSPPIPEWVVIRYGVLGTSSMSSTPMRVDDFALIDDSNLHSRAIIEALPTRCR